MKKVLVVYAHPAFEDSRLNQALINGIKGLQGVSLSHLYAKYPDEKIDVLAEQQLVLEADLMILQFPFFWFSTTPLMKKWIDEVFLSGFAYGPGGNKLQGKTLMLAITTGGSKARYANELGFTLPELLKPFEYTARYCNMLYQHPFVVDACDDAALAERASQYAALLQNYVARGCEAFHADYPSFNA